jgi:hypothetical protein
LDQVPVIDVNGNDSKGWYMLLVLIGVVPHKFDSFLSNATCLCYVTASLIQTIDAHEVNRE